MTNPYPKISFHCVKKQHLINWMNDWQKLETSLMLAIFSFHHLWMSVVLYYADGDLGPNLKIRSLL